MAPPACLISSADARHQRLNLCGASATIARPGTAWTTSPGKRIIPTYPGSGGSSQLSGGVSYSMENRVRDCLGSQFDAGRRSLRRGQLPRRRIALGNRAKPHLVGDALKPAGCRTRQPVQALVRCCSSQLSALSPSELLQPPGANTMDGGLINDLLCPASITAPTTTARLFQPSSATASGRRKASFVHQLRAPGLSPPPC